MSVPGFNDESSLYQSGVSYYSSPEGTGTSGPGVLPAQGSSSCFGNCFQACALQCLAQPFWTWGSRFRNCSTKCNLQPCPPPTECQNGNCVCAPPFIVCNGKCTSLQDDPSNCGACGVQCPPWNFCSGGQCFPIT